MLEIERERESANFNRITFAVGAPSQMSSGKELGEVSEKQWYTT